MQVDALYAKIQSQLDQQLPFVYYRKASETILHGVLQNDNHLYELDSYTDSGFVFAPFDSTRKTILIPFDQSTLYKSDTVEKLLQTPLKKSITEVTVDHKAKLQHIALVKQGIDCIKNTESLQKVVLSRTEEITKIQKEPLAIFKELISNYPTAFVYCWYHPKIGMWLGATPETLLTTDSNTFFTMALAGTQLYKDTMEVQWGAKEKEEHALVHYFIKEELSKLTSTVSSSDVYTHKAGTLLHLRVDIKGVLDIVTHGIDEVITALHPTPAVCGLPKEQAKSFILDAEGYDRKYYTGFLGELNSEINQVKVSNLYVNLRCMELQDQKAIVYVGGGITQDSDPENEWEETVRKTETMKRVLY